MIRTLSVLAPHRSPTVTSPTAHPALLVEPSPEELRAAWAARMHPADAAEELALGSLVAAHWRRARLDAIEDRLLRALLDGSVEDGLPSLATVCRYAARLAKDLELARERLQRLRDERPRFQAAERLRPTATLDPSGAEERASAREEERWPPAEAAEECAGYAAPEPAVPTARSVEPGPAADLVPEPGSAERERSAPPAEDAVREDAPLFGPRPAAAFAPLFAHAAPEPAPAGTLAAGRAAIEAAVAELLAELARPAAPAAARPGTPAGAAKGLEAAPLAA